MRVLIAEDDSLIAVPIQEMLREQGYAVDWIRDGLAADAALRSEPYDMAVLDLGLPRRDGLTILRALRARSSDTSVLILTARDEISDRVIGLDSGADDYLVKPFALSELSARMRALARRRTGTANARLEHADVVLDAITHEVWHRGVSVALSAREFSLLEKLMVRPTAILSRSQLEDRLYTRGEEPDSNAIEVYVHGLRRKLGTDFVRTVRGLGYTLKSS